MIKKLPTLVVAAACMLSSCHLHKNHTAAAPAAAAAGQPALLSGRMYIADTIKAGDPVLLKMTVYNTAGTKQQFCKWHTPFEPLMSQYLEIKKEDGTVVLYHGPMAKRVMPPPADSYLSISPQDSLSAGVDLLKAYAIGSPGKYTITYTGGHMSGIAVTESVSFVYGAQNR